MCCLFFFAAQPNIDLCIDNAQQKLSVIRSWRNSPIDYSALAFILRPMKQSCVVISRFVCILFFLFICIALLFASFIYIWVQLTASKGLLSSVVYPCVIRCKDQPALKRTSPIIRLIHYSVYSQTPSVAFHFPLFSTYIFIVFSNLFFPLFSILFFLS